MRYRSSLGHKQIHIRHIVIVQHISILLFHIYYFFQFSVHFSGSCFAKVTNSLSSASDIAYFMSEPTLASSLKSIDLTSVSVWIMTLFCVDNVF